MVASVSLVELAGRIRTADAETATANDIAAVGVLAERALVPITAANRAGGYRGAGPATPAAAAPGHDPTGAGRDVDSEPAADLVEAPTADEVPARRTSEAGRADRDVSRREPEPARGDGPDRSDDSLDGQPPAGPRAAIAYWHAKDPGLRPADIAAKVGRSRSTVRRILAELADTDPTITSADEAAGNGVASDEATGSVPGVNGRASKLADSYLSP
jgi:hypothetical protein